MKTATVDRPTEQTQRILGVTTMRAIVQDKYGSAEVLHLRDVALPTIGDHDVLIRVRAAAVNPADWAIMGGLPYIARPAPMYGVRTPKNGVRGTDVAGQVAAVGSAVTRFRTGDDVFGWCRGAFAEYAAAAEEGLALKPATLTYEQAAAVPMAGSVAIQALRDHGNVLAGQRVLINGASGGIGTFAVQIATALGAEVTGVCGTASVEMVRSIGADKVIDYTTDDFTKNGERYDFILDNISNRSLSDLRRALTPTGMLVPNGGQFQNRWFSSAGRLIKAMVSFRFASQRLGRFVVAQNHEDLIALTGMIDARKVTPVLDRTYPLRDTAAALEYIGAGHAHGKVVISV
jgi:NADPH:quinone reductase-like Zn-dependent oxidoreductase